MPLLKKPTITTKQPTFGEFNLEVECSNTAPFLWKDIKFLDVDADKMNRYECIWEDTSKMAGFLPGFMRLKKERFRMDPGKWELGDFGKQIERARKETEGCPVSGQGVRFRFKPI